MNQNGVYDPGGSPSSPTYEAGLSGWRVYLDTNDNGAVDAGEPIRPTDGTGGYTFSNLPSGTYTVRTLRPVGWEYSTVPTPTRTVTVRPGLPATRLDLPTLIQSGNVAITVFNDLDGDGTRDAGEPGIAGWQLFNDSNRDNIDTNGEFSFQTDADGRAFLNDFLIGTYRFGQTPRAGWRQTTPTTGYADVLVEANQTAQVSFGFSAPAQAVVLSAVADAYVFDGASASTNFGSATTLNVKKGSSAGVNRETYLRFDLSGTGPVSAAKLRLNGALNSASGESVVVGVYASDDLTWPENDVTWNTKPAAGATPLATQAVTGTTPQWYEWDVTEYLRRQQAAGAAAVTLVLRGVASSSAYVRFASDEAADAATRPQLLVTAGDADQQPPSVASLTVRGSAWPAEFAAAFAAAGLGDGGYALPAASSRTLPWFGADTLVVRFSEGVLVQADDLRVRGSGGSAYAFREFRYDPASFTATWVLSQAPGADRLTIELEGDAPGGVTDAAGNYLGGGRVPTGDYAVAFNVLQGDATGDGVVNSQDLAFVKQRLNKAAGSAGYSLFADIAPDGRTNATDLAAVKQRLNRRLPAAQQVAAPPGSMGSIPWRDDDEDSLLGTSPTDPPLPA